MTYGTYIWRIDHTSSSHDTEAKDGLHHLIKQAAASALRRSADAQSSGRIRGLCYFRNDDSADGGELIVDGQNIVLNVDERVVSLRLTICIEGRHIAANERRPSTG